MLRADLPNVPNILLQTSKLRTGCLAESVLDYYLYFVLTICWWYLCSSLHVPVLELVEYTYFSKTVFSYDKILRGKVGYSELRSKKCRETPSPDNIPTVHPAYSIVDHLDALHMVSPMFIKTHLRLCPLISIDCTLEYSVALKIIFLRDI